MFWKFGQTANLNPGPAAPNPFSGAQLPPAQPLTADQSQAQAQSQNAQPSSDPNVPIGVDMMDDNDLWQWLVQAPFQALLAQQNGPNAAKQASIREAIARHLRQERNWIRPLAKRAFIRNIQRANGDRTLTSTLKRGQATTGGAIPRPPSPPPTNPAPPTPPANPTPQTPPHTNPAPPTPPPINPTPQTPAPGQPKPSGAPAPQTPPAPQDPLPPNAGPHEQEKQHWEWIKQQQQQMMQQQQQMWNWIMQNGGLRRRRRWGRMAPWQMQPGLPGMNNPMPGMPGPNNPPEAPGPGVNNPQGPGPNNPPGMPGPNNPPGVPGAGPGINNPRAGNQRGQNINTPDPLKVRYQQQREALRQHQWDRVFKWWRQAQRPDLTPAQRERALQAYQEELERAKKILDSFDRLHGEFNTQ
jgi:hypothetical protein